MYNTVLNNLSCDINIQFTDLQPLDLYERSWSVKPKVPTRRIQTLNTICLRSRLEWLLLRLAAGLSGGINPLYLIGIQQISWKNNNTKPCKLQNQYLAKLTLYLGFCQLFQNISSTLINVSSYYIYYSWTAFTHPNYQYAQYQSLEKVKNRPIRLPW